jgi:hypothetical protein
MEGLQLTMKTTHCELRCLSDLEMACVCGGGDTFARDAGQFIGGAAGYGYDHPYAVAGASLLFPCGGAFLCLAAGLAAAISK